MFLLDTVLNKVNDIWSFTDGSANNRNIGSGKLTVAKDREHATLTTTPENGSFIESDNVTQITFKLFVTSAATGTTDATQALANAFVTFDPPSDAVGDLWLIQGNHQVNDSMRKQISMGQPLVIDMPSSNYLTSYRIKAGYLPAGMTIGCSVEAN